MDDKIWIPGLGFEIPCGGPPFSKEENATGPGRTGSLDPPTMQDPNPGSEARLPCTCKGECVCAHSADPGRTGTRGP